MTSESHLQDVVHRSLQHRVEHDGLPAVSALVAAAKRDDWKLKGHKRTLVYSWCPETLPSSQPRLDTARGPHRCGSTSAARFICEVT